MRYWSRGVIAEVKADESPVTVADREAERVIAAILSDAFPADGLLGEEGAARESHNGRRWIIDPIDGTRDFVRGNPAWAVLIGLEEAGEVVAGVANLAATGEMVTAARGSGAWLNGARVHVSGVADPAQAVLCVSQLNRLEGFAFAQRLMEWMKPFWAVRSMGGCLDATMVARGQADLWIEPAAAPWDLAALKIIVEEAGGRFFNFDGGASIGGGNCVCCTPGLEALARAFVRVY